MIGGNLANGSAKNKRRELDFYPTPPEVTRALMHNLVDLGVIGWGSVVWEPACGDGAMSEVLAKYVADVVSTDLRETGYGTGNVDFLNTPAAYPYDAIITNPPFNVSAEFIKKALGEAPVVAMLLKSQYWHASKRTDLFNNNPPAYVLALNWRPDFMGGERGGAPTMECLWTVWIDGKYDTRYRVIGKPL